MVNGKWSKWAKVLFTIHHLPFTKTKSPLQTTRGLPKPFRQSQSVRLAELFSRLFYVAASRLNSPRLVRQLLKHRTDVLSSTTPAARRTNRIFISHFAV